MTKNSKYMKLKIYVLPIILMCKVAFTQYSRRGFTTISEMQRDYEDKWVYLHNVHHYGTSLLLGIIDKEKEGQWLLLPLKCKLLA